jgi:ribosomal protein L21
MEYAICQIAGKQVIVEPGKEIFVPYLGDVTSFESDKVLLISTKGNLSVGAPFLKETLKFNVVGETAVKTRVAFYKPKANHRKAVGQNTKLTKIVLA